LSESLLFVCVCNEESLPNYKPSAPSWSWSSIPLHGRNAITYDRHSSAKFVQSPDISFVNIKYTVIGSNPFGWVTDAVLTVQGRIADCILSKDSSDWHLVRTYTDHAKFTFKCDGRVGLGDEHACYSVHCLYLGSRLKTNRRRNDARRKGHFGGWRNDKDDRDGYGLVLQKVKSETDTFRRIGLFIVEYATTQWIEGLSIRRVDVV
jgi:hypothetical protein